MLEEAVADRCNCLDVVIETLFCDAVDDCSFRSYRTDLVDDVLLESDVPTRNWRSEPW